MTRIEAINEAVAQSQKANGERRYAVEWSPNPNFPQGRWTVETCKPLLAAKCFAAIGGRLEHA